MNLPIKTRLTLWYVVLFAIIVGIWSGFVVVRTRADLYASVDRELGTRASQIAASLNATGEEEFEAISVSRALWSASCRGRSTTPDSNRDRRSVCWRHHCEEPDRTGGVRPVRSPVRRLPVRC